MSKPRQPDPAQGVFETLLVHAGQPVELNAHLARLSSSLESLYRRSLPPDASTRMVEAVRGISLGRLRLTAAPADGGLAIELAIADLDPASVFPTWERGAALRSVAVDGGLGPHKWVDRRALLDTEAQDARFVPLLIDHDDAALEAGRANVFAIREGVLLTPSADGRILPGIARARTIDLARQAGIEMREKNLPLGELREADGVFLTGSVRGVEPAVSLNGEPLAGPDETMNRLADALRRLWLSGPS